MFCGRTLSPLWFILARMKISLDVVWLKSVFRVCMDLFRTPHGLTKQIFFFFLNPDGLVGLRP